MSNSSPQKNVFFSDKNTLDFCQIVRVRHTQVVSESHLQTTLWVPYHFLVSCQILNYFAKGGMTVKIDDDPCNIFYSSKVVMMYLCYILDKLYSLWYSNLISYHKLESHSLSIKHMHVDENFLFRYIISVNTIGL